MTSTNPSTVSDKGNETKAESRSSPLFDQHALPTIVAELVQTEVNRLYNSGHIEEFVNECYTADSKTWTEENKTLFGRAAMLEVRLIQQSLLQK
jgi:hypothetical protein